MSLTVLRFVQLLSWFTLTSSEVKWDRRTDPVIFGGDVILFCSLSDNFNVSFTRQWKTGSKRLTFDERSADRNKYEGSLEQKGFTLKIKQFRVKDFGRNYTCLYQFEVYTANLTTDNYQWNPQPGTYRVDVLESTVESVKVEVRFNKIYPEPNCNILIGQKSKQAKFNISSLVVDRYFWATNLSLEYHYNALDCGENVSILCKIGSKAKTIITENISALRQCEDAVTVFDAWETITVPCIIFVLGLIVVVVCIRYRRRKYFSTVKRNDSLPMTPNTEPPLL